MAEDASDRSRWLAGLQYYRKDVEMRSPQGPSAISRLKSYVEPVNRMNGVGRKTTIGQK